ncbi:MAG TPA: phosphotransferase [Anaerolineales bacterium]|nr:phosphotransferase [Anaerolineales bacterium]
MSNSLLPWQQPDWQAEVRAWIQSALEENNLQLTGEIEQPHVRSWSTVITVPTNDGVLYFKASASIFAHETALTNYLASFQPELFPKLLAVDMKRHWMLMRDAGTPLRQFIRTEKSIARWKDVLPLYVKLQKAMAERTTHLLALGVMDRRLAKLPDMFENLIADESTMLLDQEESLTSEEFARIKNYGPEFARMCERLTNFGIPESIHHDDFHDANIFVQGDGKIVLTDWGESAVTHPFFTLVVIMRSVDNSFNTDFSPESEQVRDMYLEYWTSYAPMEELRSIVKLAQRIGYVNRALTWKMSLDDMPEELQAQYAIAVPSYLKDFING